MENSEELQTTIVAGGRRGKNKKKKPWRRKMSKKGTSLRRTFLRISIEEKGFRRMKEEGQIYKKIASKFLIFAWGLSYDLSKV